MSITVFTNGCFDIIHPGHIDLLERARSLGDRLIVGINSDDSVRKIKGSDRPFIAETDRREILLGLRAVDEVVIFDDLTPEKIIEQINPDVLVKGGDWKISEIIGADHVTANGGKVYSIPLKAGHSSSKIVEKVRSLNEKTGAAIPAGESIIENSFRQHQRVFADLAENYSANIAECADLIYRTLANGGKILICGNGGSAADAQHIAAEFVGRFETERRALPAISLTTDTSALTALANDYDFEKIFARQVEALANESDCLIAISTSGNSPNVIAAVMTARRKKCKIFGMTGINGKKLASLSDVCFAVPSDRTARIQEAHITAAHIICEIIDSKFTDK